MQEFIDGIRSGSLEQPRPRGAGESTRQGEAQFPSGSIGLLYPFVNTGDENVRLCGFRKCYVCVRISGASVTFSFSDRVEVAKHALVRFIEKESVLLNLDTECYYGLDEVGTRMWQMVTAAPSI